MQRFKTWQLFAICVLVWGTTWHAITYQLGEFPAEVGVALRFARVKGYRPDKDPEDADLITTVQAMRSGPATSEPA